MKKQSLYLGGGFGEHQILYMIPIIDGICSKTKISSIIFEKKIPNKIYSQKIYSNFFKKYNVCSIEDLRKKQSFLNLFLSTFVFPVIFFFLSFIISKKILLNKKYSWFYNQLFHAFWDTCIINNKKRLDSFELKSRIKTSIFLSRQINIMSLLKKNNIKQAVIQHTVYQERFLFSLLRKNNIQIYVQTKHVLIKQKKNLDFGFKFLDRKVFLNSFKYIKKKSIEKYWFDILKGKSNYLEARIASNLKNKQLISKSKENVIMLHIFKDSPFTNIDRSRIFPDYYTWVLETLKIIRDSKEKWIIRKHPSADRWGENQKVILGEIFFKVFGNKIPKNIIFEDNQKSNLFQFKVTKRLITFSGNSHLEGACFGIKPIIISNTTLCDFNPRLFFKPKSYDEYKKLLLKGTKKDFKIPHSKVLMCKRILYLIHNVVNFSNDVNSFHVFRSDSKRIFKKLYKQVISKIKKNYDFIFKIGYNLNSKYIQSINKKYMDQFHKKIT